MSKVHFMQNKLTLLYTKLILEDSSFWQNVKRAADIKIRGVYLCMPAFVSPHGKGWNCGLQFELVSLVTCPVCSIYFFLFSLIL